MKRRKGFTTVELLIVILIVAILVAVAVPMLRGRVSSAKWSEGKTMAGSLATAIRSWVIVGNRIGEWTEMDLPPMRLGIRDNDLSGIYFNKEDFTWQVVSTGETLTYLITVRRPDGVGPPEQVTLSSGGTWNTAMSEAK